MYLPGRNKIDSFGSELSYPIGPSSYQSGHGRCVQLKLPNTSISEKRSIALSATKRPRAIKTKLQNVENQLIMIHLSKWQTKLVYLLLHIYNPNAFSERYALAFFVKINVISFVNANGESAKRYVGDLKNGMF